MWQNCLRNLKSHLSITLDIKKKICSENISYKFINISFVFYSYVFIIRFTNIDGNKIGLLKIVNFIAFYSYTQVGMVSYLFLTAKWSELEHRGYVTEMIQICINEGTFQYFTQTRTYVIHNHRALSAGWCSLRGRAWSRFFPIFFVSRYKISYKTCWADRNQIQTI